MAKGVKKETIANKGSVNNKVGLDKSVSDDDFVLVQNYELKHDQKLETKPTTFVKDAFKRFRKSKSSVVGAIILGILILLAIFVPIFDTNDVSSAHPEQIYLAPKLFESGTGWWDGCKKYSDIVYDTDNDVPGGFKKNAVSDLKVGDWEEINSRNDYGKGGYVQFSSEGKGASFPSLNSQVIKGYNFSINDDNIVTFAMHEDTFSDYAMARYSIYFNYKVAGETESKSLALISDSTNYGDVTINVSEALRSIESSLLSIGEYNLSIVLDATEKIPTKTLFIKSITTTTNSNNAKFVEAWSSFQFTDANQMLGVDKEDPTYWQVNGGVRGAFKVLVKKCSFVYDTYEAAYGITYMTIGKSDMDKYIEKGWCTFDYKNIDSFVKLSDKCPVETVDEFKIESFKGKVVYTIKGNVSKYKYLGFDNMPKFLMGTDKNGHDMFKYVFEGLRTSLIMGVVTAAVCFTFGLIWGAISGYFGGNVDLAMERLTDILSGMPWLVVMTLCILNMGRTFFVFVLALCLTGWIGTASTTRTQFYRFKGREYVLASRTLGASDFRLIFKHILPNAMGTIITGAVLMIPSVIFSEATLAYLQLGLRGVSSFGVILSDNQGQMTTNAYLMIFPSIVIALLMISFNLFGNGLRDAINPSLKGEDE